MVVVILLAALLLSVGIFFIFNNNKTEEKDAIKNESSTIYPRREKTIEGENGDLIYIPSSDAIHIDENEEVFYYNNLLNVYLSEETSFIVKSNATAK